MQGEEDDMTGQCGSRSWGEGIVGEEMYGRVS